MNLYLLDSLPPGGVCVCGEPGAESAVGNGQLVCDGRKGLQMMLSFLLQLNGCSECDQIAGFSIWNIFDCLVTPDGKDVLVCRLQI